VVVIGFFSSYIEYEPQLFGFQKNNFFKHTKHWITVSDPPLEVNTTRYVSTFLKMHKHWITVSYAQLGTSVR
jgi:hypothetical protein